MSAATAHPLPGRSAPAWGSGRVRLEAPGPAPAFPSLNT